MRTSLEREVSLTRKKPIALHSSVRFAQSNEEARLSVGALTFVAYLSLSFLFRERSRIVPISQQFALSGSIAPSFECFSGCPLLIQARLSAYEHCGLWMMIDPSRKVLFVRRARARVLSALLCLSQVRALGRSANSWEALYERALSLPCSVHGQLFLCSQRLS